MNVQIHLREVVREVRSRILPDGSGRASTDETAALLPLREEINRLEHSYEQLCSIRHNVGRMPASPNTARARVGGVLVRIVRQMLFWYTPQVHAFHDATVEMGESLCAVMDRQYAALQRLHTEIAELRAELRVRGAASVGTSAAQFTAYDSGFDHLLFTWRKERSGPGEERRAELHDYATHIDGLAPPIPDGPWLDIHCEQGLWLDVAAARGRDVIGIEDNAAAAAYCRQRGLNVIAGNPLAHLESARDCAYSVVSAMEVADRYSPVCVARLLRQAVRVLKPQGVLLFEAVNPASLVTAAEELWTDPGATRPWPMQTAEFFLQYFGLKVVSRHGLQPYSAEERLPFEELEFIQQLNARLYGPRRYALLARKPAGALGDIA
ncbi:MAG: hypothetical protein C5B51_17435 [Terriglobia bacterium]|nr:MAG: hypothetical protein C5B51_17435 [Terriglobia bacterium]